MKLHLTNPLTRMKVKQQLILLFLLLVSPVFALNWYANARAEDILKQHVTSAYAELNKQNLALMNRDMDTVSRVMTTLIQHSLIQSLNPMSSETADRVRQYADADKLLSSYSMGMNGGEAVYYYLYAYDPSNRYEFAPTPSSKFKAVGGVYFYNDKQKPEWIDEILSKRGKGYLRIMNDLGSSSRPDTLAYVRAVYSTSQGNQVVGVLVATNINRKLVESMRTVSLPDKGEIYLTDYEDRVLASSAGPIGDRLELPAELRTGEDVEGQSNVITDGYIYVQSYQYLTQQKLIYKIPTRSLLQQQNELKFVIQLISIVYFVFCIVVMAYFWRSLLTPLQRLAVFTRSYVPGKKVPAQAAIDRNDEVGVLMHSVYGMAGRLNSLIEDRYLMEIKQKESQLQLLYQQINPHLLYNTLESIYWKSTLEGQSESGEMIKELAQLMRIGLSRGRDLITLEEELAHAKAYTSLQQKRYEYGFSVTWEIDERTLANPIPKIVIQPLIENAILHGVRYMGEDGEIRVIARLTEDRVEISVEDNGYKETDYEAIGRMLEDDNGREGAGYGIRNVQQRIRLQFGADYGLTYGPRKGGGTVARIVLPVQHEQ
ncbi:sensor histidine kinase [Cohnella sp. GCM10012308]|uniref:sensor histidine kinase n=1 Tax=Cohnella sp. GCM10012308 TaxID=3317329 RepID=UPI0036081EDB